MKVIVVSRDLRHKGGVVNFIKLLLYQLNRVPDVEVIHFVEGKNPLNKNDLLEYIDIVKQYLRFKKMINENDFDVVHLNPSLSRIPIWRDGFYLRIAKKRGLKVLFFIHGWDNSYFQRSVKRGGSSKFHRKTLKMADAIVVLSPEFKEKLISIGIKSDKIHILSTMVEADKYRPEKKDFSPPYNLLFCARLVKEKGVYEAIEAMKYITKEFPNTALTVMGDGKELKNLKEYARKIGVEDKVIFTGFLRGKEKYDLFKNSHIFTYPSYGEGFPTVVLEAMAAGLPIITTPVGGLKYAFKDGKNGFFIKSMPPNPKEIAEKVIFLLKNRDILKVISDFNLNEVKEKYDVKIITSKIKYLYVKTLKNKI